jgi:transcriptional regulator with XRE-family HTH domain
MDHAERKRLEQAGWQVGSVADFLGLTDEENVYIELRVRLAEALKARRQAATLSQKAFAAAMKSSQSRIAKAEANHHSVSLDLLIRSLIALGVSLEELGRILGAGESEASLRKAVAREKPNRKETKQSGNATKKSRVRAAKSSVTAA